MAIDLNALGLELAEYCEKYSIPIEYVFDILSDQKVVPMIRGKATEFNAYLVLQRVLGRREWSVEKLNLNPQFGAEDEDISVTHKRTGMIFKVESKNAVRGSMTTGKRARLHKVPHCKIKCHRSRSNIRLAATSNDRYSVDCFDVVLCNLSNAIIQGRTVGDQLELLYDSDTVDILMSYYNVTDENELLEAANKDWRFVLPEDIAVDGFIPRTPYVLLQNDPYWRPLGELNQKLTELVVSRSSKPRSEKGKSRR